MDANSKQKFIVRCDRAGVFYGNIKSRNGRDIIRQLADRLSIMI